jgi:hypothetical protein
VVLRGFALLIALLSAPIALGAERSACPTELVADRLVSVSPEGDLRLASGRVARLADLRLPDEAPARKAALGWLREHGGAALGLYVGPADRWGRVPVRAAPEAAPSADFAEGLVRAGFALVDPGEAEELCRPGLLQSEAEARRGRIGLWRGEAHQPIAAEAEERLRERVGRFAIVEGRIAQVGERGTRTYLNFGRRWAEDFTVVLPKPTWAQITSQGHSALSLRGRRIRVRGVLEAWNGTALTIHAPEALEILPLEPRRTTRAEDAR